MMAQNKFNFIGRPKIDLHMHIMDAYTRSSPIIVEDIYKSFNGIKALDGVSLYVSPGTVMALLGPNGAGKTTLVRILSTLLKPDSGNASVAGFDVMHEAKSLRRIMSLAGQAAAVDENLTGRENLELVGRLYHMSKQQARMRAQELLERFDLLDAADRVSRQYSGGMRRRLDLAASIVAHPKVLFLDEPTSGLDPRSRTDLWNIINELVGEGATLLLTTQYMEEADHLADAITVIDHGRIIAQGTADELKKAVGGDVLEIHLFDHRMVYDAMDALAGIGNAQTDIDTGKIFLPVAGRIGIMTDIVRRLDRANIEISDIMIRRPTLDDVFLALTGHAADVTNNK